MSRTTHITGIDIGTYQVKVVVAELHPEHKTPHVIGVGTAESKGVRHGYIVHVGDVTKSIIEAVRNAETSTGIQIKKAYFSIGGIGLGSVVSIGSSVTSKADQEITRLDIDKAGETAESHIPQAALLNRHILERIPLAYKIDNRPCLGNPEGMQGTKLEIKNLYVTCIEHHVNDLVRAANNAGIEVIDIIASPIAASIVTLNKAQKTAGCVLANIGSETVSIVVYENGIPISLDVFPIGSNDITNDIALGLKIPLEEAEHVKRGRDNTHQKRRLEEIIVARLSDIFELVESHLKKIGKNGLLPAGIIITGGGSGVATIEDLARAYLKLPSKITGPLIGNATHKIQVRDAMWSVAYGLCVVGLSNEDTADYRPRGWNMKSIKPIQKNILEILRKFLP